MGTSRTSARRGRVPRAFSVVLAAYIFAGGVMLLAWDKARLHILLNGFWNPFLDRTVPWLTLLGDGWVAVGVCLLLLAFHSVRQGFQGGVSVLLAGLTTQVLKHSLYAGAVRPREFFAKAQVLHLVPGVDLWSYNSFPSGHAATAMALSFTLALLSDRPWVQGGLAVLGLAVAFTRVYLSQHFFGDMYAGVLIGTLCGVVTVTVLRIGSGAGAAWLDQPLIRLRSRR